MLFNSSVSINYNKMPVSQSHSPQSYVLVLSQASEDLGMLAAVLDRLRCPMKVAVSTSQMMETAIELPPCLVILGGYHQQWSKPLVSQLRNSAALRWTTIVALTDCHAPSWSHQEDNPGLDGFLVKPLSHDILTSLVQSAWARHTCCATG